LIHEKSCEYAFFKFVILCALQSPFPNLSLYLSFSFHTILMGYCEKNLMARYKIPIPFINQRPSSWFLFYLYLYFILLSLSIIITNKSLYFIKSQLGHHHISNESLIELICQLIITVLAQLTLVNLNN